MAAKKLRVTKPSVEHFSKLAPSDFKLPKRFRAVVGLSRDKKPAWFLFDTLAFWEFICRIDEKLFESLPDKTYDKVSLGALIDKLEEQWPFSEEYKTELKEEYAQALQDIKAGKVKVLSI